MDVLTNRFKANLARGQQQVGLWCSLGSPIATEIAAGAGFDWLLIDMEHTPSDVREVYHQLQAVMENPVHPMVRAPSDDAIGIKRLLDMGAQSLMLPNVDEPAQAERIVAATRHPPRGFRGFSGGSRSSRFGRIPDYHARADAEIFVAVQIESARALDNIEAIAAVDGVDGLFIGPGDLSASLGYLGRQGDPEMVSVIEDALRRIAATGKSAGILTASEELARRYMEAGSRFTAVGSDAGILSRGSEALAAKFRPRA